MAEEIDWGLQDWTEAEYHAFDAISNSTLGYFHNKTPAHAYYKMTHPEEPTTAMKLGSATHAACLQPERLEQEFVRGLEGVGRRKKDDVAQWLEFEQAHPHQYVLKPEDWDLCMTMREAVMKHDFARELIEGDGHTEKAAIWEDWEHKVPCKLLADRFTMWRNFSVVADLKTTRDASTWGFGKSVMDFGYHRQASWYLEGLKQISAVPRRFFFICVEKDPPHLVQVHELDEQALDQGYRDTRRCLQAYVECMKSGIWPGYPEGINPLSLPSWGIKWDDEENEDY
jgi:exodeoxyribonuclease VIII